MRLRSVRATLLAMVLVSAVPAAAQASTVPGTDGAAHAAVATGVDDYLNGDTCFDYSNGSIGVSYYCISVGWTASYAGVAALGLAWEQGAPSWSGDYPSDATSRSAVNDAVEVSCASVNPAASPTCAVVGLHYSNPRYEQQLIEVSQGGSEYTILSQNSPRGSTWSATQDVSCPTSTYCMMVGLAGRSYRKHHHLVYPAHATAYAWNGTKLITLHPPAPAHATYSELAGLSCASPTMCMAVGNYENAHGTWLPYTVSRISGHWQVQTTPRIRGERTTTYEGVACPTATLCMAVGEAFRPGSRTFAELWNDGTWTKSAMPAVTDAGVIGVSCATTTACEAAGWHGNRGLLEAWNGTGWSTQKPPSTGRSFRAGGLTHVSCVTGSPAECVSVGYSFNPKVRPSRRTFHAVAEVWNGTKWSLMKI
jgi:hypothetical protein